MQKERVSLFAMAISNWLRLSAGPSVEAATLTSSSDGEQSLTPYPSPFGRGELAAPPAGRGIQP
jgi:hypothetical protein